MSNKVSLKQSNCYRNCNDVNCDAITPDSIFGDCDFNGTINLISLKQDSDKKISMILEIDISKVDFTLYVINKTIKKTMEFTVITNNGYKFDGSFSIAFQHLMNFPIIDGKFSYKLYMPYEITKIIYNLEHECMFTQVEKVGLQQCNEEICFENMNGRAKDLKWHKGQISIEFNFNDH